MFFSKGNAFSFSMSFPTLITRFRNIAFFNEKGTGYISEEAINATNEEVIGAIITLRNPPSCFLFHLLLFQFQFF